MTYNTKFPTAQIDLQRTCIRRQRQTVNTRRGEANSQQNLHKSLGIKERLCYSHKTCVGVVVCHTVTLRLGTAL